MAIGWDNGGPASVRALMLLSTCTCPVPTMGTAVGMGWALDTATASQVLRLILQLASNALNLMLAGHLGLGHCSHAGPADRAQHG